MLQVFSAWSTRNWFSYRSLKSGQEILVVVASFPATRSASSLPSQPFGLSPAIGLDRLRPSPSRVWVDPSDLVLPTFRLHQPDLLFFTHRHFLRIEKQGIPPAGASGENAGKVTASVHLRRIGAQRGVPETRMHDRISDSHLTSRSVALVRVAQGLSHLGGPLSL